MTSSSSAAISTASTAAGEVDAGPGPLAVEVGGDDERHRRQRVVVGHPGPVAVAQLELPRPPPPGEAIGEPDEQRRPGVIGVDGVGVEAHAGAPGDVGGPLAHPVDGPAIGPVVAELTAHQRDPQREIGGQSVAAAAHDVALLDHGGHDARQAVGPPGDHAGQPGVDGQPDHRPPERRDGAGRVDGAELVRAARRACCHGLRGGGSTNASCSSGVPHAASSSASPARSTWVISAARWAGRVPCSIRLHSR